MNKDLYTVLGISADANADEIKQAYFKMIRLINNAAPLTDSDHEKMRLVQEAYEILSDPARRASYDQRDHDLSAQTMIQIKTSHSRSSLPVSRESQRHYVCMEIECLAQADEQNPPPFHLCLVLDRSTSMQSGRIEMVRDAFRSIVPQMRSEDLFSVVGFSDRADVVLDMLPGDQVQADAVLKKLVVSGGTEIFQGLNLGVSQLEKTPEGYLRQLILLTDGHTYGDDGACVEAARKMADQEMGLSCLGIGHDWNDQLLDRIAAITGGSAMLISKPDDLTSMLKARINSMNTTFANQAQFHWANGSDVELVDIMRLNPEPGPLNLAMPVPLGTINYRGSLQIFLEFVVHPREDRPSPFLLANGRITMQRQGPEKETLSFPFEITRNLTPITRREAPPPVVLDAARRVSLFRMQERARKEVAGGQIDRATRRMHYLATHLLTSGDRDLAHTVLLEAEHIQQSRRFSKEGDKRIKYGTRVLLTPGEKGGSN